MEPGTVDARGLTAQHPRLAWPDVAKAIAIILVVLYHVSIAGVGLILPGAEGLALDIWRKLSQILVPVRIPLFFLVAGFLATKAVHRAWAQVLRPRYLVLLWPYLIWSVTFSVVYGIALRPDPVASTISSSLSSIVFGGNAYWFLSALVVFFTIARLFRKHPATVILVFFALWLCSSVISNAIEPHLPLLLATNVDRWVVFGLWFMVGCFASELIKRMVETPRVTLLVVAGFAYAGLAYAVYIANIGSGPWRYLMNITGLISLLLLSTYLARSAWVAKVARYIAQRTLPIYLVHPVLVYGAAALVKRSDGSSRLPTDVPLLNALFVPFTVALLVAASVLLYDFCIKFRMPLLFEPPRFDLAGRRVRR